MDGTNPDVMESSDVGITAAQGKVSLNHHVNCDGFGYDELLATSPYQRSCLRVTPEAGQLNKCS